mmetsp:Transcript_39009/g.123004  ORF Transcript_39009/g.123004 Transcript_39009/m.123004 type:complete len:141 (+) Transcript_39009:44-466(+)
MGAEQSCCAKRNDVKQQTERQISRVPRKEGEIVSFTSPHETTATADRVGIGAYFQKCSTDPGALQVKSLLTSSPAHKCGKIQVGDIILKVDGENVYGKKLAELAEVLLGPTGSKVELEFKSKNTGNTYEVLLLRGIASLN